MAPCPHSFRTAPNEFSVLIQFILLSLDIFCEHHIQLHAIIIRSMQLIHPTTKKKKRNRNEKTNERTTYRKNEQRDKSQSQNFIMIEV